MKPIAYLFTQDSDTSVALFCGEKLIGFWRGGYLPAALEVIKSLYGAGAVDIRCQDTPAEQALARVDTFQTIIAKVGMGSISHTDAIDLLTRQLEKEDAAAAANAKPSSGFVPLKGQVHYQMPPEAGNNTICNLSCYDPHITLTRYPSLVTCDMCLKALNELRLNLGTGQWESVELPPAHPKPHDHGT